MIRRRVAALFAATLVCATPALGCASATKNAANPPAQVSGTDPFPAGPTTTRPATDQEVTFDSGGVTIHGSFRQPASAKPVPAVVLLAGSGPTDRNGDSSLLPGNVGTLKWLADRFAAEGVATLRYDKLGTGATGLRASATIRTTSTSISTSKRHVTR